MYFDVATVFQSNTEYRFTEDVLHVSLSDTKHLTDKIYRATYPSAKDYLDTAFYLKDLKNVTLDFGGATLLLHDDTIEPFVLDECENVTIKNVTVEYERCLLDEIDVVDVRDGEIYFKQTEKQKKHFPVKVENGCIVPICNDKEYRESYKAPHFFNLYDKETQLSRAMCLVRVGKDLPLIPKEQFPFKYFDLCAEEKDGYIILRGEIPTGMVSDVTCAQSHSARDLNSCFIIRSKNTRLENFRILNGAGMGIIGMYSENITLDGLKLYCDERSHGIATNAADAVHLISCFGQVEIVNSILESMKDDAINIHSNYYTVESVEGQIIHAKLKTDIQKNPAVNAHYKTFGEGDSIVVCNKSTMLEKAELTVESLSVTGDFTIDLIVKGDLSCLAAGDSIENLSVQPDIHIKNCRFGKAKTHLRFQTRGEILMEDSECSLKIMLPGDKNYWYEGSPVRDLTVKNCRFVGEGAFVLSEPEFDVIPEAPYYHKGIKIINNTFDAITAMKLSHCDDILFEGNVNTRGVAFENVYTDCGTVIEN